MKRFLVLGTGNAQVDLIRALKGRYEVHGCSHAREGAGIPLLDAFAKIDIREKEEVLAYCQKHEMDLVYSIGSDIAMPTASWVSEQLALPHLVSFATATDCNAKHRFRQRLSGTSFHVRHQQVFSVDEPLPLPLPVMVKPADSQGQRGVRAVHTWEEYRKQVAIALDYSPSRVAIVEELLAGSEISVNAFLADGEIVFSMISDRWVWPNFPGGLVRGHQIPSQTAGSELQPSIIQLVKTVVDRLEILNGPVYFQIMVENGMPKLVEVTPRLDGCHLWRMIFLATGVNLLEMSIQALEKGASVFNARHDGLKHPWHLEFFCEPPGTVFDQDRFPAHPNSMYREVFYAEGERVRSVNGYMEKCGYQIVKGTP